MSCRERHLSQRRRARIAAVPGVSWLPGQLELRCSPGYDMSLPVAFSHAGGGMRLGVSTVELERSAR
jgi:hypothetical protein